MIITLKNANFSGSNIGTIDTWGIACDLGFGAFYEGPYYVDKNASLKAAISVYEGYILETSLFQIIMDGKTLDSSNYSFSQDNKKVEINIEKVIGNIKIKAFTKLSAEEEEDLIWTDAYFVLESGTTRDDEIGTMGNKVANANRIRLSAPIVGDVLEINMSTEIGMWVNFFDEAGQLVATSGKTITTTTGKARLFTKGFGATQAWIIFRTIAGTSPLTEDQINSIDIKKAISSWEIPKLNLELGTFSDETGEKVESNGRVRTGSKLKVPSDATGIRFIPTGTIDLWIKGYSSNITKPDLCNGLGSEVSGQYWNTKYKNQIKLTWNQIIPSGVAPQYIDLVFKADAATLFVQDIYGTVIAFSK